MNKKVAILLLIFSFCFFCAYAQDIEKIIKEGNEFYKQEQYDRAISKYNNALKIDPANTTIKYNLALALYRADKKKESVKLFNELTVSGNKNDELRSKAFYNEGAVFSRQKQLEESIEAYKNTLRLDPTDKEARENLQKALLELKKRDEKPPPQPQKQNKQSQSKLNTRQAEQKLDQLEQKEKQVQQRVQQQKSKSGSSQPKDW
jgi:Ca-activated chloride channel family protein